MGHQWKEAVSAIFQERNQTILERWNAGDRVKDIAADLGLGLNYVYIIIRAAPTSAKITRKRGRKIGNYGLRTAEIINRCRSGESYVDLAQEFDVSLQRISQVAKRAGLDRKRGGHILSTAILAKKAKAREEREQTKAKRQAEKAARKAERQKLIEQARTLRANGKTWAEIKDTIGVSGSYYLRLHPEAREREFAPRRRGA